MQLRGYADLAEHADPADRVGDLIKAQAKACLLLRRITRDEFAERSAQGNTHRGLKVLP
jgi:hypothetical protein